MSPCFLGPLLGTGALEQQLDGEEWGRAICFVFNDAFCGQKRHPSTFIGYFLCLVDLQGKWDASESVCLITGNVLRKTICTVFTET